MTQSQRKDEAESAVEGVYGRGLGIRHLQVAVMSLASFLTYALWTNLSIAIVAMVDKSNATITNSAIPNFDWDEKIQGYVLSSFFWGYVITQIPAGLLSNSFGGQRFLCAAMFISSALNLTLPQFAFMGGWTYVCINRMLHGLSQGFVFPAIFSLLGVWIPPAERSVLASVAISAQLLGAVLTLPATGFLISAYGWPSVFHIVGSIGIGCSVIMIFLGADSPSKHRLISNSEKTYIQSSLGGAELKRRVPWKKVLSSTPFLSAAFGMAFHASVFATILTTLPMFIGTVLKFSITDNGIITALPYLVSWLLSFFFSWLSDFLISRGVVRVTTARKLFNSIAHFGGAFFIFLLAHAEGSIVPVIFLTCAIGLQAGVYVGISSTFVDLAPNFSGAIFSLANCVSQAIGACGPNVVGFIVSEEGSAAQWRIVFYLYAFLWTFSNIVFLVWGTSETQYWNWPDRYNSKLEYEKSKDGGELQEMHAPVLRRYSLHGAELMG